MENSIAIAALIISVINAISHLHLRKVNLFCINSECYRSKSVPPTPVVIEQPKALLERSEERLENNIEVYITNGS